MKQTKDKIIESTIEDISFRVKELIEKIEKKKWNDATLTAFQVGLSSDVENGINKAVKSELKDLQEAYNIAMKEINRLRSKLGYDKK